jgi:hypothetical protein
MNPAGVSQIGNAQGGMIEGEGVTSKNSAVNIHAGRGYMAPKGGHDVHPSGSQGKHK